MVANAPKVHCEWLKEQLALAERMLSEAQTTIAETQASIIYFKEVIYLLAGSNEIVVSNFTEDEVLCPKSKSTEEPSTNIVELKSKPDLAWIREGRSAKEMLMPEYAELTIGEAVSSYMSLRQEPIHLDEAVDDLFVFEKTQEELKRVKQCLNNEMQRGKKEGRWENVSRGKWGLVSPKEEILDDSLPVLEAIAEEETIPQKSGETPLLEEGETGENEDEFNEDNP